MCFFAAAPRKYRRVLAVLRHLRGRTSLAEHYVKRFSHMIPRGVEVWEIARNGTYGHRVYPMNHR